MSVSLVPFPDRTSAKNLRTTPLSLRDRSYHTLTRTTAVSAMPPSTHRNFQSSSDTPTASNPGQKPSEDTDVHNTSFLGVRPRVTDAHRFAATGVSTTSSIFAVCDPLIGNLR